jgi:hypothetical protein
MLHFSVPCGAAAMIFLLLAWVGHGNGTAMARIPLSQMDFLGSFLLLAASVLLVFGLQQAGSTTFAWNSPTIVATLTIASLSWISLALWQYFLTFAKRTPPIVPIFSLKLVTQRVMLAGIMYVPHQSFIILNSTLTFVKKHPLDWIHVFANYYYPP